MTDNIKDLNVAAALISCDNALRPAANIIVYYGVAAIILGGLLLIRNAEPSNWARPVIGVALLVESYYIRRSHSPRAMQIAGLSLAAFAAYFLGFFAMSLIHKTPADIGGLIASAFLVFGAYNILSNYSAYKQLLALSNPLVNRRVREAVEALRLAAPSGPIRYVELKSRGAGDEQTWRLMPEGDLILLCSFDLKTFGYGGRAKQVAYISQQAIQLHVEGERWLGSDVNARLCLGGDEIKIRLSPEMMARLESILAGVPSPSLQASRG